MNFWDDLAALAVPLIWILILVGRFLKNRREKQAYYEAEEKEERRKGADNKPINPPGTNW